jgi:hypothetical protein
MPLATPAPQRGADAATGRPIGRVAMNFPTHVRFSPLSCQAVKLTLQSALTIKAGLPGWRRDPGALCRQGYPSQPATARASPRAPQYSYCTSTYKGLVCVSETS